MEELHETEVFLYLENPDAETLRQKCSGSKLIGQLKKERKIFFINNVKFHIDYLENVGHFIEIEAIDSEGIMGREFLHQQCNFYKELLQIKDSELINDSYIDLQLNTINQ